MGEPSNHRPMLIRYLQCPELMGRMMERTGVGAAEAVSVDGGLAWLEACTKCIFCRDVGTCCDWFEGSDAGISPADFCRNSKFFGSCVERSSVGLNGKPGTELYGDVDSKLVSLRLQQLRLDPEYLQVCCTSVYQQLERVCESCKSKRFCARDLASGDVEAGMRSYCPNAPTIDALTVNWVV